MKIIAAGLLCASSLAVLSDASLRMSDLFGDGMVLSSEEPLIHGYTEPGAYISVKINGTTVADAKATDDGLFVASISPRPASQSQHQIDVLSSSGGTASARGAMFGTVILCGGQSNMVHPVSYDYNATEQLAFATPKNLPNLRLFRTGRAWGPEP